MNQPKDKIDDTTLQLHRRGFYHAQSINPGATVICEQGILWLTQSDDFKDYMLKPGDRLVMSKKTNILVEALSDARISIIYSN